MRASSQGKRATQAVFFDWFNTLARYQPPREEIFSQALHEFGVETPLRKLTPGLLAADSYYFEENTISPVEKRKPEEKAEIYLNYQRVVLEEAGIKASRDLLLDLMKRVQQLSAGMTFVLFDDVLSTLKKLKERKLILGLLTNATRKMVSVYRKLGLEPYLDFALTSEEAGASKPHPPIFLAALRRAGVDASTAVYVGDQYKVDIVGARGVGITPILIDRYDLYPNVGDCPRINNLDELFQYV